MARYERDGRDLPVDAQGKVKLRRTADGKLEIKPAERKLTETVEAQERPPQPDDPRSATARNVPPYAA
jgi:hypothetical protein